MKTIPVLLSVSILSTITGATLKVLNYGFITTWLLVAGFFGLVLTLAIYMYSKAKAGK